MAISLYDATIPSYLQILGSALGLIEKAEAFCAKKGISEDILLTAHFVADMLPLAMQFKWLTTNSLGSIEGARAGSISPDRTPPPEGFGGLRAQINATLAALKAITPDEIESLQGKDMIFSVPAINLELPFKAENFLLSFSLPNFYFHATTAYDLLRHHGVAIGKRDFLGAMRINVPA